MVFSFLIEVLLGKAVTETLFPIRRQQFRKEFLGKLAAYIKMKILRRFVED